MVDKLKEGTMIVNSQELGTETKTQKFDSASITESQQNSFLPKQNSEDGSVNTLIVVPESEENINYNKPWRMIIRRKISDG